MARRDEQAIFLVDARGGRNGADPPLSLPDTQVCEARNVDWWYGTLANKRRGAIAMDVTCASGGPFVTSVDSLYAHLPTADLYRLELWAVTYPGQMMQFAGSPPEWNQTTIPTAGAIGSDSHNVTFASAQGWLFACFPSNENRLHVWTGSAWRLVGLKTPLAAPTVATLAGAGLTKTRHYRVRWVDIQGADTVRRSEASASASLALTDDVGWRVTRPTAASEGETHWEVEAADVAAGPWYRIAQVVIATTTYDDTAATIPTTNVTPTTGANIPPTSWRYIIHDQGRLLGAGNFYDVSTGRHSRVWFTAQLGATAPSVGDLERVPETTDIQAWVDLDEHDGGFITGFGGPMEGAIYVFKYRQIWKLVRTGSATAPYRPYPISKAIGCIRQQSVVMAEDEFGNPALYFLSHRGPYRLGGNGLEYIGNDIEDLWESFSHNVSVPCCGVYYPEKHQVWWFLAINSLDSPNLKVVFDTRLGQSSGEGVRFGWSVHDGLSAQANCAAMFSETPAPIEQAIPQKPYVGKAYDAEIWTLDTDDTDVETLFAGSITTRAYPLGGLLKQAQVEKPILIANAADGVTIQGTVVRDFGAEEKTDTVVLTPTGSETRVSPQFEALELAGATVVQYRIGDVAPTADTWTLDALVVPYTVQEHK